MNPHTFAFASPSTLTLKSRRWSSSVTVHRGPSTAKNRGKRRSRPYTCAAAADGNSRIQPAEFIPSEDLEPSNSNGITNGTDNGKGTDSESQPTLQHSDTSEERRGILAKARYVFSPQPVDRKIAAIALPALGALSIEPMVALADMACVGYLGAIALASVAVANNVFNMSFTCFNFLGMATTPAIARSFARNDRQEASRLIAQALWVACVIGITASCLLGLYAEPLVRFFGASATTVPYAVAYLRSRIFAAPFLLSSMVCNGAFRGFQDTRSVFFVSTTGSLTNLILFPTLIFGARLGVVGAGIATTTAQCVSGTLMFSMLLRKGHLRLSDLRRRPSFQQVLPLLRTGAVLSVRTLSIFSTISFATATAAQLGTVQVAAFEIGRQIYALFARLLDAISVAAQALVSLTLGQGETEKARDTANRILQMGVALGCGFVALLMLMVKFAPRLFTSDPAVAGWVSATFPFMAAVQPLNGLVFVFDGIYTAGRKFTTLSISIFIASVCSSSVLYFVRQNSLSLPYVWIGLNVMMVLRASLLGIMYFTKRSPVPPKRFAKEKAA